MNTPAQPAFSGRCHKATAAAKYLGMCPKSFRKIKDQIPCSPILPGSVVMVWRECDLDNWKLQQMQGGALFIQDMQSFIANLP